MGWLIEIEKSWKSRLRRGIREFLTSRWQEIPGLLSWVCTVGCMESYMKEVVPQRQAPK